MVYSIGMRPLHTRVLLGIALGVLLVLPIFVLAQQPPSPLPAPGEVGIRGAAELPGQTGLALPSTDPRIIVAKIIRTALGFLGIVAIALILYGGFLWMTSAGNEEQIGKAKKILINAAIGLVIILSAVAITQFVINKLLASLGMAPLPPPAAAPPRVGGGALGSGIVESHFPMRGATNIPRNTRVIVTFKEKIDAASIPNAVKIIKTADIEGTVRGSSEEKYVDFMVANTEDLRTFVFTPVENDDQSRRALLGSATENTGYTVYLCGTLPSPRNCPAGGIKLLAGQPAFLGAFKDYQWAFEVGTFLDVTPPQIHSVIPAPASQDRPRNTMVQVNFNEAILPTVASGKTLLLAPEGAPPLTQGLEIKPGSFSVMRVQVPSVGFLAGEWQIGNQYRTSEFTTTDLCGRNSCGQDVFCLPALQTLEVQVRAATLAQAGDPASKGLFDGLEDVAGNSLDGNRNGAAQGPGNYGLATFFNMNVPPPAPPTPRPGDNARLSFTTSDTILLGSAVIESTAPVTTLGEATSGVALLSPLAMTFNRSMAMTTLSSRNLLLSGAERATGGMWEAWWTVEGENLEDTRPPAQRYGRTLGRITHGGLWLDTDYTGGATSRVRDLYQNCYYPGGGQGIQGTQTECHPDPAAGQSYCCNGVACAAGDVNCGECGF